MEIIIAGLIAVVVLWWLLGRVVKAKWLRWTLRLVVLAAVIGGGSLLLPQPTAQTAAASDIVKPLDELGNPLLPVESTTVARGDLLAAISATGRLAVARQSSLYFEFSYPVRQVYVTAGQPVRAGDILAEVDTTDLEDQLRTAQAALLEAQANYNSVIAPPREIDLQIAQAEVNAAQAALYAASLTAPTGNDDEIARLQVEQSRNQLWQQQLNRDMAGLPPGTWINGQNGQTVVGLNAADTEITIAQTNYADTLNTGPNAGSLAAANGRLAQAQQALDQLQRGPTAEQRRQAEISVETAQLSVQQAEDRLQQATLRAPFAGIIAQVNLAVGQMASRDRTIIILDTSRYNLDMAVNEVDIPAVKTGQNVQIVLDGMPDQTFSGQVAQILDAASAVQPGEGTSALSLGQTGNQRVMYAVRIQFDPGPAPVRPGMSATSSIVQDVLPGVLLVPNRYIQTNADTQQSFVLTPVGENAYQRVYVTVGARNRQFSEITGGVDEGLPIVILPELPPEPSGVGF